METSESLVPPGSQTTIGDAKEWLRAHVNHGARCPCCTQMAKVYVRAMSSSLTAGLVGLYKLDRTGVHFHHINELLKRAGLSASVGREFSIVRYWGLIAEKRNKEPGKRTSGFWKITAQGIAFVERRLTIQSHVKLYDSKCLGFQGKIVYIEECLKKRFNYEELMRDA